MTRFHTTVFLLSMVLCFFACKDLDELTKFDISYDTSFTVPSESNVNLPLDVFTPEITTDSENQFQVNDTRKDLIEKITLTSLELIITAPEDEDFGFLKSVQVFMKAEGLNEIMIASKEDIPENIGNLLVLDTVDEDLKEYIKKDEFSLNPKCSLELRHEDLNGNTSVRFLGFSVAPLR